MSAASEPSHLDRTPRRGGPIPYELRVGVTGHRSLKDETAVRTAVRNLVDRISATLQRAAESPRGPAGSPAGPWRHIDRFMCQVARWVWPSVPIAPLRVNPEHRTPIEWVVFSALAKGSDRIVADEVLARSPARLCVIAPFAKAEYERDFADPDDLAGFRRLWAAASDRRELKSEDATTSATARNECYLRAGRETVDACEVLIAVWDGRPAAGKGGTADVVAYALDRGRDVYWIDAANPAAEPRLLVRNSSVGPDGPLPGSVVKPIPSRAKVLSPMFHQLSAYNRDPADDEVRQRASYEREGNRLRGVAAASRLSNEILDTILLKLLPHFSRADQFAIRYQGLYVAVAVALYALSASAVTIAVFQVLFFPKQLWLIGFEVLAMFAAVVLLRIGRTENWHEKWLHDRHLAEQLRMAIFTGCLEAKPIDSDSSDELKSLPFYGRPDGWVDAAARRIIAEVRWPSSLELQLPAIKHFVIDGWIKYQAMWHASNANKKYKAAHRVHVAGLVLFVATLAAACLHWAGIGHGGDDHGTEPLVGHAITFIAIVCPAWGAAIHAINVLRERERLANRSAQMAGVLNNIAQRAEQAESLDDLRLHLEAARQVMAGENLEWWISLSFRPLVLPA